MRTIAHISDVHFGTEDPAVVDALVAELNDRAPALVVVSGDLTQRARVGQYRKAAEFLARIRVPQLVVPGNHDIPLYNVVRRFAFPLTRFARYITPNFSPFHRDDEFAVMGLNTARPFTASVRGFWKDGEISEDQVREIELRANALPRDLLKIVVTHHPFIPPPGAAPHDVVHGAAAALAVFETCGIDLLLAGHLHKAYSGDVRTHYEATKRSMLSIQAGTATSDRRRGEPNAYNWIVVGRDEVTIEVRGRALTHFTTTATKRFVRTEGVWNAAK